MLIILNKRCCVIERVLIRRLSLYTFEKHLPRQSVRTSFRGAQRKQLSAWLSQPCGDTSLIAGNVLPGELH